MSYTPTAPRATSQQSTPTQPQPTRPQGIWSGRTPNPGLSVKRRGPNKRNRDASMKEHKVAAPALMRPQPQPSITNHLLARSSAEFSAATQRPFLSHAGSGTLAAEKLGQWLSQDAYISRGYISLVGALISKIRLPQIANSQIHPSWRTMDLLISALNNVRREMSFFEITASKYQLAVTEEAPNPVTKAYLDLFTSASSPSSSLLEGMVVLWATEHVSQFLSVRIERTDGVLVLSLFLGLCRDLHQSHDESPTLSPNLLYKSW